MTNQKCTENSKFHQDHVYFPNKMSKISRGLLTFQILGYVRIHQERWLCEVLYFGNLNLIDQEEKRNPNQLVISYASIFYFIKYSPYELLKIEIFVKKRAK